MRIGEIRPFCQLQDEDQSLMRASMSQLQVSARAYRILKLARTIADLKDYDGAKANSLFVHQSSGCEMIGNQDINPVPTQGTQDAGIFPRAASHTNGAARSA